MFFDAVINETSYNNIDPGDEKRQNWIGYSSEFATESGGSGLEINYFEKGAVLKAWGLQPDPVSYYSLLRGGIWLTFPTNEHSLCIETLPTKTIGEKIPGCKLQVFKLNHRGMVDGEQIFEMEIKR